MSYVSNQDLAHQFFYDLNGSDANKNSVSYKRGVFYSYSTAVCRIFTRTGGGNVAMFSENNFSATTAKHLSYLKGACPFDRYHAFFDYGDDATEKQLFETSVRILESYSKSKLSQKANRETFKTAFNALKNFLEFIEFKSFKKEINKALKKYQSIFDALENKDALKALSKKQIEAEKRKKEQAERKRKAVLKKFNKLSLMEKAKLAYNSDFEYEQRAELKQALNPSHDLSFCWIEEKKIRTSQQITVDLKDACLLLKAWKNGKLKHGQTIDRYTVLSVSDDFIKVGCHLIPTENLFDLCKELNI